MGVSKFVLKLRLYKDKQKFEIFCSSFERGDMLIKSAAGTGHKFNRNGCFLHIGICLTKHLHPLGNQIFKFLTCRRKIGWNCIHQRFTVFIFVSGCVICEIQELYPQVGFFLGQQLSDFLTKQT